MSEKSSESPPSSATGPSLEISTRAILASISDGVFTVDLDWHVLSFNRAAEQITGVPRSEALGRRCEEVFRSSMCGPDCPLRRTLATGDALIGQEGYMVSPEGERIPISVSTALLRDSGGRVVGGAETFRDMRTEVRLRQDLEDRELLDPWRSRSPLMRDILDMLPAVAMTRSTVLIQGETGTGKELLARTLHDWSLQKGGPFVAVNCGAFPETLLESELFGYKAGAFTGAARDKPGRLSLARGGTLFLDEIGEISPALQVRLLRVLQEKVFEPLGAVKSEKADFRVITATHRDLQERMRKGLFREDLYYRIHVVPIRIPTLRDRREDIPLLVQRFLSRFNVQMNRKVTGLSPQALSVLMGWDWPGNIRELENLMERILVTVTQGQIGLHHLPAEYRGGRESIRLKASGGLRQLRAHWDRQVIEEALRRHGGRLSPAARDLGVHPSTLSLHIRQSVLEGVPTGDKDTREHGTDS